MFVVVPDPALVDLKTVRPFVGAALDEATFEEIERARADGAGPGRRARRRARRTRAR